MAPNLWVYDPDVIIESVNWIKVDFIFDLLNKRNNRLFLVLSKRRLQPLGMKDFILFNDSDIFRSFYLKELLNPVYEYLLFKGLPIVDRLLEIPWQQA